jgi:hypothetical protein
VIRGRIIGASLFGCALASGAFAAPEGGVAVQGQVEHALELTIAALKAMPQTAVDVSFETGHGTQSGHYTGVLLWQVIEQAGIVEAPGSKAKHHLQHPLVVTGRDGYSVVVAVGEIDPDLEGKQVILTDDDEAGSVRLIVPGDKHGARDVRDVVRVEVE